MKNFIKNIKSDSAYMGFTHALSALAVFLVLVAFLPAYRDFLQFKNVWFFIIVGLTIVGASLIPDLDNTQSTIKSDLGIFGDVLSAGFRASSVIIQSAVRTRKDDSSPNPHRGFWHTLVAAILTGVLVLFATRIGGTFSAGPLGKITVGYLIGFLISFILMQLAISTVFGIAFKKIKSSTIKKIVTFSLSFIFTFIIFLQLPNDMNFTWLAVSVAMGMAIHDIGDTTTTSGTALLWPIPIRGKMWWNIRLTPMKAGGVIENMVLIPLFSIVSIVALFVIIKNGIII